MSSNFIGVIRNALTGEIYAVVNPDGDHELDDPKMLLLKRVGVTEAVEMVKVPRAQFEQARSMDAVDEIVKKSDRR